MMCFWRFHSPMKKSAILLVAIVFAFSWSYGEIVINEIYGGGGNSSAPFNQDFVELFNNGTDAVDISGFQLKYATGRRFRTIATIPTSTILGAGEFYVVGGANGAIGAALPHVDSVTFANLNATAGKVELLDSSSSLADLVDYGAATNRHDGHRHRRAAAHLEISGTFAPSDTMSFQRTPNGIDTDNSNLDFRVQIPTPDAVNGIAVPEPSTWLMLGIGAAALLGVQKLRRKQS
jgi:predicted extracellular nuclease